jgi:hypothetical protein
MGHLAQGLCIPLETGLPRHLHRTQVQVSGGPDRVRCGLLLEVYAMGLIFRIPSLKSIATSHI